MARDAPDRIRSPSDDALGRMMAEFGTAAESVASTDSTSQFGLYLEREVRQAHQNFAGY